MINFADVSSVSSHHNEQRIEDVIEESPGVPRRTGNKRR